MTLGRDDVLLLAVLVAVACPTVPLIGNTTNVAAALLLGVLMASRATAARLRLAYLLMLVTGIGALSTIAGAVAVGVVGLVCMEPSVVVGSRQRAPQ